MGYSTWGHTESGMTEVTLPTKTGKVALSHLLCILYHRYPLTSYLGIRVYKMEAIKLEHPPSTRFTLAPLNGLPLQECSPSVSPFF